MISWFYLEFSSINDFFALSFLFCIIVAEIFGKWGDLLDSRSSCIDSSCKTTVFSFDLQCDFNIIFVGLILMVYKKYKGGVWFLLFSCNDRRQNKEKEKHRKDTILHLNSINIIFDKKLKIINAAITSSLISMLLNWKWKPLWIDFVRIESLPKNTKYLRSKLKFSLQLLQE